MAQLLAFTSQGCNVKPNWRWSNVPVPEPYLASLAGGIVGGRGRPLTIFPAGWQGHLAGWPLVVGGALLAASAVRAAESSNLANPSELVSHGPYRFTRNPMYLGWTAMTVGFGLMLNNAWIPALAVPAWLSLNFAIVPREERILSQRFGVAYRAYQRTVRRWL